MSNRIDQRIVEMSFENHKFEKGIEQSSNSLKKFSNALQGMGSGKDFSGLENSVQSVSSSFSMMEQIGIGALRRIGEAAINAGGALIKNLTVDQLSAGMDKYQQKIEAVQTLVSAGYNLEEAEKSMAQLMWFSDETSYSFSDMAGNMAKFVSAGVDLKTSERAMQGIATWAAHSGKNSQAASIAMFNLSQAISMGYVDTLNWRSIMNQNMNTVMFKEIAIGVAEATKAVKKGEVTIQNFDANLKDKWFTVDVLTKTLEQYSTYAEKVKEVQDELGFDNATQAMEYMDRHAYKYADVLGTIGKAAFKASQESKSFKDSINATMDAVSSGWMGTYEIIFGTLYEAKENFTALTQVLWTVFAASASVRNEMLAGIKDAGGIKSIFQTIKNVAIALLKPLKSISQAFDQFFPPRTKDQWMGIINVLETISRRLIITDEAANKIQRTFAGFFAVIDIGWEIVKFLGSALYEIVSVFVPLNGGLFNMTASIGDFLVVLNHVIKQSGIFQYGLIGVKIAALLLRDMLSNVISKVSEFVRTLWTTDKPLEFIGYTIKNIFSGIIDSIKTGTSWISNKFMSALYSIQKFLGSNFNINSGGGISEILRILKDFIGFLVNEATDGIRNFGDVINSIDFNKIATFVAGGILLMFINQLTNLTKSMATFTDTANSFVTKFSKKLFGTTTKIKELAYVFGVLSASIYVLSRIPWDQMKFGLLGLAGAIAIFVAAYAGIQAITVMSSKALNGVQAIKSTFSLVSLAGGLAILAIAIGRISKITDEGNVWKAIGVIGAMMVLLTAYQALGAVVALIPGTNKVSVSFAIMNAGLLGLIGVIALLTKISPEVLKTGLSKLWSAALVITAIQTLFGVAARVSGGNKLAVNFLGMTVGMIALVGVLSILSVINVRSLSKGVANALLLGGVLAAIQLMFNIAGRIGGGVKFKTNILAMQMGLLSMVVMVGLLSGADQDKIQNGIKNIAKMGGIIAALEILTAVAARIGGGNKLQKILGSVSLTMLSFTVLIGVLSIYTPEQINKGLFTITAMMGIIVAFEALSALTSRLGTGTGGAGAILGMVTSILAVTASLILLSILDEEGLRNATIALSVAVVAVGVMAAGFGVMLKSISTLPANMMSFTAIVKKILPGFVVLASLILATIALIGVINLATDMLQSVGWESLGKFTAGLVAISTLAAGFTVLAGIPSLAGGMNLKGLIPGFAAMAAVVVATLGLFYALSFVRSVDWDVFGQFMIGLSFIGAMAAGLALLGPTFILVGSSFGPAIGGMLIAVAGAGLIIAAFVGLASGLEALFGTNPDFLINAIDKLVLVGNGFGRFIGAMAGGFKTEVLIGYGEGLAGFADAVKEIDPASFGGVESLSRALLTLTGAAILDGLAKFLNFGKNPGKIFGEQLKGLIQAFKGITTEDATQTSNVLAALGPMANNLKNLAEATKNIPNSGGLLGALLGNNDVDVFGDQLKGFINGFSTIVVEEAYHASNVLAAMTPMASNLKAFAKAAEKIPNSGGFLGKFLGNNDVDTFGDMLVSFIAVFSGIDVEEAVGKASIALAAMQPMMSNLKDFATVAGGLPNSGGMVTWFSGDNDIKTFVGKIAEFVKLLGTLDSAQIITANGNLQSMTNDMLPGLERFANLSNSLNATGGWKQSFDGETSLVNFAQKLKDFVNVLKGVDVSIVAPALKSLSNINESFKVVGSQVITNALASFENNKRPFQAGIAKLLDDTITLVDSKKEPMSTSFSNIFINAIAKSRSYIGDFKILGEDLVRGLQNGIQAGQSVAIDAINTMTKNVIRESQHGFQVNSPSKVFGEIGRWLPAGLGEGIKRNSRVAILASANMGWAVEEATRDALGIHSLSDAGISIGTWWGKSVGTGVEDIKGWVADKAKELGVDVGDLTIEGMSQSLAGGEGAITTGISSLLELLTGEKSVTTVAEQLGIKTGDSFTNGYAKEISKNGGKKVKDAFQIFKESIDYRKEYNLISLEEELAEWIKFAKKYAIGTEIRMKADKEASRVRSELDRKSFDNSKRWIEEEKYYKRLSLLDELAAWERVQARYAKGHEYRMQAERELFRLKEELRQAEYQNSLNWIEEEKYYNRLNLTDELKAWGRIQARYVKGSEERKKADREVFRLENEIRDANLTYEKKLREIESDRNEKRKKLEEDYYNKTKEIKDRLTKDIQSLTDEYENAVKSRAQSLYSAWGIFDKVEISEVSGQELVKNLEDQVVAFDQWQAQINALAQKGVSEGLVNELRDMGPKSLAQIVALNKLSGPELDKYVALWNKKTTEAKDQAVYELQDMKAETNQKIIELTREADMELDYYEQVWRDSLREVNRDAKNKLEELETEWVKSIGGMTSEGVKLIKQFRLDWFGELQGMISDTRIQISELQQLTKSLGPIGDSVISALGNVDTKKLGVGTAVGFSSGVFGTMGLVASAGVMLGKTLLGATSKSLDMNSPSKEFIKIGRYSNEGLAEGLRRFSGLVYAEGSNIGRTALESIALSIDAIPDLLDNDMDTFTITPVLDLSDVKSGMYDINSILNSTSGLNLETSMGLLPPPTLPNQNGILAEIRNSLLATKNQEVDLTGMLTVQVVNDKGEIIDIAETAIKDILRRESR